MKKQLIVASLFASVLAASVSVHAEGMYAGARVGNTEMKADATAGAGMSDNGTSMAVFAGTAITSYFGAEVGYVNFGTYFKGTPSEAKMTALYFAGTATYPINPQVNVFAKAGFSQNKANSNQVGTFSNTGFLMGVGAEYNFTNKIGVVAEYENFGNIYSQTDGTVKAQTVSVGMRYKF
jgi:OOP family OmpA-OmpF porin